MSYSNPIYNFVDRAMCLPWPTQFSRPSINTLFAKGARPGGGGLEVFAGNDEPVFAHDPLTARLLGFRIEPQATFLGAYSSQLDNPAWSKWGTFISPNVSVDTYGNMAMDKIVENNDTNSRNINRTYTISPGSQNCFRAVVSAAGRKNITLNIYTAGWGNTLNASFDLSTGVCTAHSYTGLASNQGWGIKDLGGGRYLVWVSGVLDGSTTSAICSVQMWSDSGMASYQGDGVSGVCVAHADLEAGAFPTSILPTGWETTSATSNSIGTGSKTFTVTHDSIVPGKTIPAGATFRAWQTSNSANYMTGTVTSHTGTSLVLNSTASGGSGSGITDWTIQAGAQVTRAADVATVDLTKLRGKHGEALWNGVEATLLVDFEFAGVGTNWNRVISLDDGTVNNAIAILLNTGYNPPRLCAAVTIGGVAQFDTSAQAGGWLTPVTSTRYRAALGLAANDCGFFMSGGVVATDASVALPVVTTMRLGNFLGNSFHNGYFHQLSLYNRRLSNSRLQAWIAA